MAFLGKINGPMLSDNLVRLGVDLAFETDLVYLDVNNNRIGINTNLPTASLTVVGNVLFDNALEVVGSSLTSTVLDADILLNLTGNGLVNVSYLTNQRVLIAGANGAITESSNLTFDGNTLTVNGSIDITTASLGNLSVSNVTISSQITNSDIVLDPNGTGQIEIPYLTSNSLVLTNGSNKLTTDANFTYSSGNLSVNANLILSNITISNETISSTGNIDLTPTGTTNISNLAVGGMSANSVVITDSSGQLITDSAFTYDSATDILSIGNLSLNNNTISSQNVDGNISLSPNGNGSVILDTTTSVILPVGTTSSRPTPVTGMFRFNTTSSKLEYYTGSTWLEVPTDVGVFTSDTFTGDGSSISFNLSKNSTTAQTLVSINGTVQKPTTAYTVSGNVITFTEAPLATDVVEARILSTVTSVTSILDNTTSVAVDDTAGKISFKISNSNIASFGIDNFTSNVAIAASSYISKFNSITGATGTVVHNCVNGTTFVHNSIASDFTVNLTNLNLASGFVTNVKLLLNQGATAYVPTALQISSVAQTINWQGGSITGTTNKKDVVTFEIYNDSGTYTICANLVNFG